MGRLFNVTAQNMTLVSACRGLITLSTSATEQAAGGQIKIHRVEIGQTHTTTAQMITALLSKRDNAATLTVVDAHAAVVPLSVGGLASVFTTAGTDGKAALQAGKQVAVDSNGAYLDLWAGTFCNLNGWLWIPVPGHELIIHNTSVFVARLLADPTDFAGWNCSVTFEEL
jgi:hypothetical protein